MQADRVVALSEPLIEVHQGLREQLASLWRQAIAGADGAGVSVEEAE